MKTTTGTITATGSGSAVSHELNPSGPDTQAVVGVSGTFTSATVVVEGKLWGGSVWYPLLLKDRKTGARGTGSASPSDSTATSWRVDAEGLSHVRAYVSAGTPTDVDVEITSGESDEFGGPAGDVSVVSTALTSFGAGIAFTGATAVNVITMPDNLADALSISEGSNAYVTFVTTDSGERVLLKKQTRAADSVKLAFGDGDDITVAWDGTDLDVLQAAANSSIKWGVDGAGIDQVWYGDTASTSLTWDQSADSLIFTGAARVVFTGTTGQPEIHLTDNLADALSIEISGSTDLLVFTTTDDAESVSPIGLRTRQSTGVAITGATTLKLSDSGGIFTVSQGAAYDIDLPSPTSGPGCSYFFSLTAPAANNVTLTVAGSAATFVGSITIDGATIVATGSTLTFASGASSLGDSIEVRSIATNLYHVRAFASGAGGITIA